MDCVETQAIKTEVEQPIACVIAKIPPHFGSAKIQCRTPGRKRVFAKKFFGVKPQVISVRPEMVIDHVEHHTDPQIVSTCNKFAEVIGCPVTFCRGKGQDPVVSPVTRPGKGCDGHQFQHRDAQRGQFWQLCGYATKSSQQTGMAFINHTVTPWPSGPTFSVAWGGDDAPAMHASLLKARPGVGECYVTGAKAIGQSRTARHNHFFPSVTDIGHG